MRAAAGLALLILSAGCPPVEDPSRCDAGGDCTWDFVQRPPAKVDVLFVVDDSCSMEDEQAELGARFEAFTRFFDVAQIDYRIGVTTTSEDERGFGRLEGPEGEPFITNETLDPAATFLDRVRVGIEGGGFERGLAAAEAAVGAGETPTAAPGFVRADADLSVIYVSDEEDQSRGPTADHIQAMADLKAERGRRGFNASALVGADPATGLAADCAQGDRSAAAGERYADIAEYTGGVVGSICEDDFTGIAEAMGLVCARLQTRFELPDLPRDGTLEVEIEPDGGDPLPAAASGPWPWIVEEIPRAGRVVAMLTFTDPDRLPPPEAAILVRYRLR